MAGAREICIDSELSLIHLSESGEAADCSVQDESCVLPAGSTLLCSGHAQIRATLGTLVIARIARI